MRANEFTKQINEVPMNPGAYAQSLGAGAKQGVKVGFEFEVCVPRFVIRGEPDEPEATKWYENAGADWYIDMTLTNLDNVDVSFNAPLEYNGEKYTKIYPLVKAWLNDRARPILKSLFDKLPDSVKAKVNATWSEMPEPHDELLFAQAMRITKGVPAEIRGKMIHELGAYDNKDFWVEVFGTSKLAELANNPQINLNKETWSETLMLAHEPPPSNGYDGNSDYDYSGAAKVLKPVIEREFGNVKVFHEYHQSKKRPGIWYIEPDGSLEPESGDGAAEVVTPPMPVTQGIEALKTFYRIARELKLYTSAKNTTGLHINVSIPAQLDVLKLAIFTGDTHVIQQWGREDNTYVVSVINGLQRGFGWNTDPVNPSVKEHYNELLDIAIDISNQHEASISFDGKYVSFRHVGGDYLNQQEDVLNVIGRFVRAMVIASDPNAYRKEYLIKLTKLLQAANAEKSPPVFDSIAQYQNKPISVMVLGLYTTGPDGSVSNMFQKYDRALNGRRLYQPLPGPESTQLSTELLNNAIAREAFNGNTLEQIAQFKQDRAVFFRIDDANGSQRFQVDHIAVNRVDVGKAVLQQMYATPGTQLHALALKELVAQAKDRLKEKQTRRDVLNRYMSGTAK